MKSSDLWKLFEETGAPELYLLYTDARKMEHGDVCNDPRPCITSSQLQ